VDVTSQAKPGSNGLPEVFPTGCPTLVLREHVMSKWGNLVLLCLSEGTHRWSELRRRLDGVSEKMLAQTLQTLQSDRLVHREAQPVIPPHVDYSLTDRGRELAALLVPLRHWIAANADDIINGPSQ